MFVLGLLKKGVVALMLWHYAFFLIGNSSYCEHIISKTVRRSRFYVKLSRAG